MALVHTLWFTQLTVVQGSGSKSELRSHLGAAREHAQRAARWRRGSISFFSNTLHVESRIHCSVVSPRVKSELMAMQLSASSTPRSSDIVEIDAAITQETDLTKLLPDVIVAVRHAMRSELLSPYPCGSYACR